MVIRYLMFSLAIFLFASTLRAATSVEDLGDAPPASSIDWIAISPDCHNIAISSHEGNQAVLQENGKPTALPAGAVSVPGALFSPDARRLACILADKTGQAVQLDGISGAHYDTVPPRSLLFSADSKHLYYSAQRGGNWFAVLEEKKVPAGIATPTDVMLSADGQHLAYVAETAVHMWDAFLDGKSVTGQFHYLEHFVLTPDGDHWAFVAGKQPADLQNPNKQVVVVDDKASEWCYRASCPPTFSPDGKHVAFALRIAYLDPTGRRAYDNIAMTDWQIDDNFLDLKKVLYNSAGTHTAWVDAAPTGERGQPIENIVPNAIFLDGKVLHQGWLDLAISPDGKHVASKSTDRVGDSQSSETWLDGVSIAKHFEVGPPLFSPDSKHLAFATQNESGSSWDMVLDGQSGAASGLVFPTVDADERAGSWKPDTDFEEQTTIENGKAYIGQYPYHFDSDGTLVYFRITDGHLYRIHWKPDGRGIVAPTTMP